MKRVLCVWMAFVFLFLTSCGQGENPDTPTGTRDRDNSEQPTYTAFPGKLQKQEAVFATLSADGTVQKIDVTDRLTTDVPQVQVRDVSILKDIRNLKGAETPYPDGVELTWHMQTTQLYYAGTTDKALPVALSIRWYFNGAKTDPQAIKGKAGDVRVEVHASNTTGADRFVPFLLAGGIILGGDATAITVENGSHVGDGSRELAFGVLMPGLAAALGLDAQTPILPQQFTVAFHTEKFTPGSLYFVLLPVSTAAISETIEALFGAPSVSQMDLSPLLEQIRAFSQQNDLSSFLRQAADSATLFRAAQNAMQAYSREQPLLDVLQRYLTPENAALLQETIDSLSGTSLSEYATLLQNPLFISLMADMGAVSAAFTKLIPTLSSMIGDLQTEEVRSAIAALPDTMQKLQSLTDALEENAQGLEALSSLSQSGALTQLGSLLGSVQSVLDSSLLDTLQSLSGKAISLEEKLDTVMQAGKEYGIFTSAPKDAETSVYFVLKVG